MALCLASERLNKLNMLELTNTAHIGNILIPLFLYNYDNSEGIKESGCYSIYLEPSSVDLVFWKVDRGRHLLRLVLHEAE